MLPTPKAQAHRAPGLHGVHNPETLAGCDLQTVVQAWPTPKVGHEYRQHTAGAAEKEGRHGWKLPGAVADAMSTQPTRPWPTPDAGMVTGGRVLPEGTSSTGQTPDGRKVQVGLVNAVKAWATPQHHDSHQGQASRVGRYGTKHGGRNLNDDVAQEEGMERAKLHGRWTLALMGFPPDWCDDLPADPLNPT